MKFNCGPDKRTKYENRAKAAGEWSKFFLWLPKRIGTECRWLEFAERRAVGGKPWVDTGDVGDMWRATWRYSPFGKHRRPGDQLFWSNYPEIEYRAKEKSE